MAGIGLQEKNARKSEPEQQVVYRVQSGSRLFALYRHERSIFRVGMVLAMKCTLFTFVKAVKKNIDKQALK